MNTRLDYWRTSPAALGGMRALEKHLAGCAIEAPLLHLVKLRASQINGCAYCIDMHWKDLRAAGENEQRLYGLDAWRESPYYTERERAALAWTEALTNITDGHAPDEVFEHVRAHFSDAELVDLTVCITTINAWNRIAIGFRSEPGTYRPQAREAQETAAVSA
jgi:AhpD family alkylhydroperoxidase